MNVSLPARILKYDSSRLRADIELLAKKELEGEQVTIPPILEVPVSTLRAGAFVIVPPYSKGDVVQVLFNQSALDNLLITGDPEEVEYKREYSFDDAVVIGGLQIEQADDLPDVGENLYIGGRDGETKIEITPDSEINITCEEANVEADEVNVESGDINLGQGVLEPLVKENFLSSVFDTHTHTGNMGSPTTPPIVASNPNNTTNDVEGA